ncbi:MAG: hypothetical protein ACRDL7_00855, partial [Gaiellaceae bacterium]
QDTYEEQLLQLDKIVSHRYADKGRQIELKILWKNGQETYEKLSVFRRDYPMAVAEYAREKKLFQLLGFKWVSKFLKVQKLIAKMTRTIYVATVRKSKRVL